MLKNTIVVLLLALSLQESFAAGVPNTVHLVNNQFNFESKISSAWGEHAKDFVELIDVERLLTVIFGYMNDPEVLNFVTFIFSEEFTKIIWQFETMDEFKEAFMFLSEKGYDVDSAINFINSALNLPPFEKPKLATLRSDILQGTGMTGLINDLISALPMEEMKALFETKLETSPEVAELFDTINSPEFLEIMKKMSKNPKFIEIKETFAGYGFDFKYLCAMAKEIFGEYYQGVFCEN